MYLCMYIIRWLIVLSCVLAGGYGELSISDREMFWREVMSTLQDRFVSSLAEIESWAAENLLNSDSKLLSQLQLSVGLAYAISNATPSRLIIHTAYIHAFILTCIHTYIGDDSTMAFSTNNELLLLLRSHSSLIMDKLSHLFRPDLSVLHTAICLTKKSYCFFHTDTTGSIPMYLGN